MLPTLHTLRTSAPACSDSCTMPMPMPLTYAIMPLAYFAKHKHREVHVQTHRQWLASKNSCELPDWPDVGEQDCLFGAVLRAMDHCKLAVTGSLAEDLSDVLNVAAMRNEAVAGAQAIYDDESFMQSSTGCYRSTCGRRKKHIQLQNRAGVRERVRVLER